MPKQQRIQQLIDKLKRLQREFNTKHHVPDIISNSKIFEVIIANALNHDLFPGHAGLRDAKDDVAAEYEYKHFKESSSNHTWTFNDFSDATITNLKKVKAVIFAHLDDTVSPPIFDWYYYVPGAIISTYLESATTSIQNKRKMINISIKQIEKAMTITRTVLTSQGQHGKYQNYINRIFSVAQELENIVGTKNILTSNKFWELLIALKMGHRVLSEQKAFDAVDSQGDFYEYKVAKNESWAFEDISEAVLGKFKKTKAVYLAKIDKSNFLIKKLYVINPKVLLTTLRRKLIEKDDRYKSKGKQVRRLQVSLSRADVLKIKGRIVYQS